MSDILDLCKALVGLLREAGAMVKQAIITAMTTVVILLMIYAGGNIVYDGSISGGLHSAFVMNRRSVIERDAQERALLLQLELRNAASAERVTQQILTTLLDKSMNAARIRVSVIHNGVTGLTGMGLLRFDVTHAVSANGRAPGPLISNQPLSDWSDYLEDIIHGKCVVLHNDRVKNSSTKMRLDSLGITLFVACPITDASGQTLGGVFVSWDRGDTLPSDSDMLKLLPDIRAAGSQIAALLDLRRASH